MIDNKILGNKGEILIKKYLINQGYQIIANNYRVNHLEIDLIVKYQKYTIFIEIKTRVETEESLNENPLNKKQIKNLKRAINKYCFKNHINLELTRLDLIVVLVNKIQHQAKIKHYHDIF